MKKLLYAAGYRYLKRSSSCAIEASNYDKGEPPYLEGNGNWVKPEILWDCISHLIDDEEIEIQGDYEELEKVEDYDIEEGLLKFGYNYVARDYEKGLCAFEKEPYYDEEIKAFYAEESNVMELHTSLFLDVKRGTVKQLGK